MSERQLGTKRERRECTIVCLRVYYCCADNIFLGLSLYIPSLPQVNSNLCAVMSSHLDNFFNETQATKLLDGFEKVTPEDGTLLWSSSEENSCLFLVIRGSVRLQKLQGPTENEDIHKEMVIRDSQYANIVRTDSSGKENGTPRARVYKSDMRNVAETTIESGQMDFPKGYYFGTYKVFTNQDTKTSVYASGTDCKVLKFQPDVLRAVLSECSKTKVLIFLKGHIESMGCELPQRFINDLHKSRKHHPYLGNEEASAFNLARETNASITELEREKVKFMFKTIDDFWKAMSMGMESVPGYKLGLVRKFIGESGLALFDQIFGVTVNLAGEYSTGDIFDPKYVGNFSHICAETIWNDCFRFFQKESGQENTVASNSLEMAAKSNHADHGNKIEVDSQQDVSQQGGLGLHRFFSMVISILAPEAKLAPLFANGNIDIWEREYIKLVGHTHAPLPADKFRQFLRHVFVEHAHPITDDNVDEFFQVFGNGVPGADIEWVRISKVLRDINSTGVVCESDFWIRRSGEWSAINPSLGWTWYWNMFLRALCKYHFVCVPMRIAYVPWRSMLQVEALCTDLVADILLIIHLFLQWNMAYKNKRSVWVLRRLSIIRRTDCYWAFACLPLDWFAFACGGSNEVCCWLRLNKMLLVYARCHQTHSEIQYGQWKEVMRQVFFVVQFIHVAACCWFLIGRCYPVWFPQTPISWLVNRIDPEVLPSSHMSAWDRSKHFAYRTDPRIMDLGHVASHDHDRTETFSSVWEQHLMSVYWLSCTLTINGAIGDVIPTNEVELLFVMSLIMCNLTFVQSTIASVSTVIMASGQAIVKAREGNDNIKKFITGNPFSRDLQSEILAHFHAVNQGTSVDHSVVFAGLSRGLQVQIARFMSRSYLGNVELFSGTSEIFLDDVCVLLREVSFSPEEVLFLAGHVSTEMFFVVSGSVEVVTCSDDGDVIGDEHHANEAVGSVAFFFGIRQFFTARASKKGAICLRLDRMSFLDVLKSYPKDEEITAQNALKSFSTGALNRSARSARSSNPAKSAKTASTMRSRKKKKLKRTGTSSAGGFSVGVSESVASEKTAGSAFQDLDSQNECVESEVQNLVSEDGSENSKIEEENENGDNKILMLQTRRKNEKINSILMMAAVNNLRKMTDSFACGEVALNDTDSMKRTCLHVAAASGHEDLVEWLLSMRADVTLKDKKNNTPLDDAVLAKKDDVARIIRQYHPGVKITMQGSDLGVQLCEYAFDNDIESIKRLITYNAFVGAADYDGRTALHLAACEGHVETVKYLLSMGADYKSTDRFGNTPLEDAVRHHFERPSSAQLVQAALREKGASLMKCNTEYSTAMCDCAARGDLKRLTVLCDNGVDVAIGDYDKRTPLHLSACNNQTSVMEFLLKQPTVQVNAVDRFGGTALDDAIRHEKKTAQTMLEEAGGVTGDSFIGDSFQDQLEKSRKSPLTKPRGWSLETLGGDGDGKISREEYNAGFDLLDTDKDGLIAICCDCSDSFSMFDKDHDGMLSRKEYEAGFNMLDVDHDGFVTKAELYKMFTSDVKAGDSTIGTVEDIRKARLHERILDRASNTPESSVLTWFKDTLHPTINNHLDLAEPLLQNLFEMLEMFMQNFLLDKISLGSPAVARIAEDCRNIATELCKVLQKARNVLDVDSTGDSAQIQCFQWKTASRKFRKGATSLLEHYHTLSVFLKVIRKIMKAVFKSSKRYFRRAAFNPGNSDNPLVTNITDNLENQPYHEDAGFHVDQVQPMRRTAAS